MLVRMMQDGQPKYIRSDGVTEITWEDGPDSGCTGITYEGGRQPVVVDGSPDEVFKALLNPPETLLKEDVAKFFNALDNILEDARAGRRFIDFSSFLSEARRSLDVPRALR